ncbi:hypothetical protein CVD28_13310 [Bacillus sp. M6-12]|nr:hypothetical protein CVD28_13310 [Bacillus sp. M6-12]
MKNLNQGEIGIYFAKKHGMKDSTPIIKVGKSIREIGVEGLKRKKHRETQHIIISHHHQIRVICVVIKNNFGYLKT